MPGWIGTGIESYLYHRRSDTSRPLQLETAVHHRAVSLWVHRKFELVWSLAWCLATPEPLDERALPRALPRLIQQSRDPHRQVASLWEPCQIRHLVLQMLSRALGVQEDLFQNLPHLSNYRRREWGVFVRLWYLHLTLFNVVVLRGVVVLAMFPLLCLLPIDLRLDVVIFSDEGRYREKTLNTGDNAQIKINVDKQVSRQPSPLRGAYSTLRFDGAAYFQDTSSSGKETAKVAIRYRDRVQPGCMSVDHLRQLANAEER
ncbi:hypothetical protein E6O75_ATG00207 [Venturia nashicola]|uniref:Uncharacterized protein n=1 Tax=Venturia nashicola TaxID=86259 RepID=A0A4Z1PVJ5_9PEZI|nr:hypothetical protein E6O75_ATG00207 [Venturia nashicola]